MHFGETAAQVEPSGALRQVRRRRRVKLLDDAPAGFQQLHRFRVPERERPPAGNCHHRVVRRRGAHHVGGVPGLVRKVWGGAGEAEQRIEVDVGLDQIEQRVEALCGIGALSGGHQPEMPRRRFDGFVLGQEPQHRHIDVAHGVADFRALTRR